MISFCQKEQVKLLSVKKDNGYLKLKTQKKLNKRKLNQKFFDKFKF